MATELKLPSSIGLSPCARRQDYIVKTLNTQHHFHFMKEDPMGSDFKGYSVCAYDPDKQWILITCDDLEYLTKPHFQNLCADFAKSDYDVCAWVADCQSVVPLAQTKEKV
jgi:hypothetical protein